METKPTFPSYFKALMAAAEAAHADADEADEDDELDFNYINNLEARFEAWQAKHGSHDQSSHGNWARGRRQTPAGQWQKPSGKRDTTPYNDREREFVAQVEGIAAQARADEPQTSTDMKAIVAGLGGKLQGFEFRLKEEASLTGKVLAKARNEPGMRPDDIDDAISDPLRYTMEIPTDKYIAGVERAYSAFEKRGYTVESIENKWNDPDKPDYRGVHMALRTKQGTRVEMQLHTVESYNIKQNVNHHIYMEYRDLPDDNPKRVALAQQMIDNASTIPMPDGIAGLPDA